jgi:hypothetical protein
MPVFEHKERGVRFEVVDEPTVEQQLIWVSKMVDARSNNLFLGYWEAAKPLIESWECAGFKDFNQALSELTDPGITEVIIWAGNKVMEYMNGLETVSKKSSGSGGGSGRGKDRPAS